MKIIIDIDEELARKIENLSPYLCNELLKRIANGIPLEDIKAEIKLLHCEDDNEVCKIYNKALEDVEIIIEHYRQTH